MLAGKFLKAFQPSIKEMHKPLLNKPLNEVLASLGIKRNSLFLNQNLY